jgi:hypothetical protein
MRGIACLGADRMGQSARAGLFIARLHGIAHAKQECAVSEVVL